MRAGRLIAGTVLAAAAAGAVGRAAVPVAGRPLVIGGRRVQVLDRGQGPAVVLIHGLGGGLMNFARLLPHMAGRRVVALDRPGAGRSDPAARGGASLPAQARTVAAVMEALGARPAVVVGHSLGGAVALQLAADRPDLVRALVTVGALTAPAYGGLPRATTALAAVPPLREAAAWLLTAPGLPTIGLWSLRMSFAPEPIDWALLTEGGGLLTAQPRAIAGVMRDVEVVAEGIGALQARLPRLAVPVTILHGAQDRVLPPAFARHLAALLPSARLLIGDGGHMLPWTQPALVAEAILSAAEARATPPGALQPGTG